MLKLTQVTVAFVGAFFATFTLMAMCQATFVPCVILGAVVGMATAMKAVVSE